MSSPDWTHDHLAISRLQTAYADLVNRRAWDELDRVLDGDVQLTIDTITRPAIVVSGPAAFREFVEPAVDAFEFLEFVILNSHIELPTVDEPDLASARIYMSEIRRERESLAWSQTFGLYQDRYTRTPGGWRIAERHYQTLTRTGADVFPHPRILGR